MDGFWADVRQATRRLGRDPGFTAVVLLIVALGVGATTALFAVARALLLWDLPVRQADSVFVPIAKQGEDPFNLSGHEYLAIRSRMQLFEETGIARRRDFTLREAGSPERLEGAEVSPGYLTSLGVTAEGGRLFLPDEGRESVALLGHALWQRRFGGDRAVVGRSLSVDGERLTVVGILPPWFDVPSGTELFKPFSVEDLDPAGLSAHAYLAVARLRDGVGREQAEAELREATAALAREHPATQQGFGLALVPLRSWVLGDVEGRVPGRVAALLGAVGLLLLIACANVSGMLAARSIGREREVAVRQALGAGRARIVRVLLTETLLLTLAGGVVGLGLAGWLARVLFALVPVQPLALAGAVQAGLSSSSVAAFAVAASVFAGLAAGLLPALRAARRVRSLADDGRVRGPGASNRRLLDAVVGVEVALSLVLLGGAGLALRSLERLLALDLGFRPDGLLAVKVPFPADGYRDTPSRTALASAVLGRLRALPGVAAAGAASQYPLVDFSVDAVYACEGRLLDPGRLPMTAHRLVTPGYLEALGVRLVAGRLLDDGDHERGTPAAVVSESLARDCFPGQDAVGRRVRWVRRQDERPWMTIVGVVGDVKEDRAGFRRDRPAWYLPLAQHPAVVPEIAFLVRGEGDPGRLVDAARRAVAAVDPTLPVHGATTLRAHVAGFLGPEQFGPLLLGLFAGLGLVLALSGVGGSVAWSAACRRQEMGVRMALGATGRDVEALLLRQGLRPVLAGAAVGFLGAIALSRVAERFLFGIEGRDPATLAAVTVTLVGTAGLAAWGPACRAARRDPWRALRQE